jgi:hypothetical protein
MVSGSSQPFDEQQNRFDLWSGHISGPTLPTNQRQLYDDLVASSSARPKLFRAQSYAQSDATSYIQSVRQQAESQMRQAAGGDANLAVANILENLIPSNHDLQAQSTIAQPPPTTERKLFSKFLKLIPTALNNRHLDLQADRRCLFADELNFHQHPLPTVHLDDHRNNHERYAGLEHIRRLV